MGLEYFGLPSYAYFAILVVEIIIGTMTNAFIVLVNLQDWLKGRSLNSSDKLVLSLALSNACFSFANAATIVFLFFFTGLTLLDYVFYIVHGVMTYAIFSSSWLSSWLCLFFFLKIINFKSGCFGWMKMKVDLLVPWLIFLSQVMSFISFLPLIWTTSKIYIPLNSTSSDSWANQTSKVYISLNTTSSDSMANQTSDVYISLNSTFLDSWVNQMPKVYISLNSTSSDSWTNQTSKVYISLNSTSSDSVTNQTSKVIGYKINDSYNFCSLIINCFVPFLIVTATTGRIIASLSSHARHMKQNMEDSRGPSLKVHQAAARTMSSLLVIYLIFYVVELGLGFLPMSSPLYWICFMLILFFPTLQSIVLISGNSKLRQICSDLMSCKKKH
ncbi:taste receptor type 2 member 9-like [Mantella aurantiaca]